MYRKRIVLAVTTATALSLAACSSSGPSTGTGPGTGAGSTSGPPKAGVATGTLTGAMASGGIDSLEPAQMSRFADKAFIPAYNHAVAQTGTARNAAYAALDYQVMSQQAPIAPLFTPKWYDFVSSRLGGYVYSEALGAINYNTLYIK
jgi:ABC-type transport system substrate-binding protein